jgi:hypothetical protein
LSPKTLAGVHSLHPEMFGFCKAVSDSQLPPSRPIRSQLLLIRFR